MGRMIDVYVIYRNGEGFLYHNEDVIGGWDYCHEIDEWTVLFDKYDDAKFNSDEDELVLKLME